MNEETAKNKQDNKEKIKQGAESQYIRQKWQATSRGKEMSPVALEDPN